MLVPLTTDGLSFSPAGDDALGRLKLKRLKEIVDGGLLNSDFSKEITVNYGDNQSGTIASSINDFFREEDLNELEKTIIQAFVILPNQFILYDELLESLNQDLKRE